MDLRKVKYTYDYIKSIMDSKGYELLSTALCKSNEKLDYICGKHRDKGTQHISIYHVVDGKGCYYCGRERTAAARRAKLNKEYDRQLCESRGFEYVDTIIENHMVLIDMICPRHRHVGVQRVRRTNLERETSHECVYCIGRKVHPLDSFGEKHKDQINLWSDKNGRTAFEYSPSSNQKVWFKCENGLHEDYPRKIDDVDRRGFRCPQCEKLKRESCLQQKVRLYFNQLGYNLNHEYDCSIVDINPITKYKMPYDNQEDDKLKLMIEVNGKQHYEIDKFTIMQANSQNKTPEEILQYQQFKDHHKQEYALSQGYNYLAIPYTAIKHDYYKVMIDEKIQEILNTK